MRRFTVLQLDVPTLAHWMVAEKEPMKVLELREEMLALIGSWANVHYSSESQIGQPTNDMGDSGVGRWLLVDETGGLVVAALAERMGILYIPEEEDPDNDPPPSKVILIQISRLLWTIQSRLTPHPATTTTSLRHVSQVQHSYPDSCKRTTKSLPPQLLSLRLFNSSPTHPLHSHLKTLSWLQLLSPHEDIGYTEPEIVDNETLKTWKSGKEEHTTVSADVGSGSKPWSTRRAQAASTA
jgi:tRNA (adenine-N(1)-)-methyltransferase non-catalytic subunit